MVNKKLLITIGILIIAILISGCIQEVTKEQSKEKLEYEILNIGEGIPEGWSYTIITEEGKMESPHGLEDPVIRIDFINPDVEFENSGKTKKYNPSLRLYFYHSAEKQEIMEIIANESVYSWCIPIYFDETKQYIIVTSPCYINSGVFTEEAKDYYSPLEKSLKGYFDKFK